MKKVISAFLLSFVVMLCVCGFAGKKDIDKASESKDLITARVSQTTSQFDAFSNCATEEEVTEDMALWNPISASPSSGCIASGCGGSVCLISGCTGSVCFASGCAVAYVAPADVAPADAAAAYVAAAPAQAADAPVACAAAAFV